MENVLFQYLKNAVDILKTQIKNMNIHILD